MSTPVFVSRRFRDKRHPARYLRTGRIPADMHVCLKLLAEASSILYTLGLPRILYFSAVCDLFLL